MDKGIENLLARLRRDLINNLRISPASVGSSAKVEQTLDQALLAMYEVGRAEVLRDQSPCDGVIRLPGAESGRAAKCMQFAGHQAPHRSADGCEWWSGADGSMLAALSRSDDAEVPSGSGQTPGQADVEGSSGEG